MVEDLSVASAEVVSERGLKRRRRIAIGIASFIVIGAVVGLGVGLSRRSNDTVFVDTTPAPTSATLSPTSSPTATPRPTLDTILEEGVLRCGVINRIGFNYINQITGERIGFDIDMVSALLHLKSVCFVSNQHLLTCALCFHCLLFIVQCRAVAAATLGDPDALVPVETTASERFIALANGTVDILSRVTTHTMERDVFEVSCFRPLGSLRIAFPCLTQYYFSVCYRKTPRLASPLRLPICTMGSALVVFQSFSLARMALPPLARANF